MQDELRDRIKTFLNQHQVGVLAASGGLGAWAVPLKPYKNSLELICLLPGWSDVSYYIEQDPQVQVVIFDKNAGPIRWLQVSGKACVVPNPDWSQIGPLDPPSGFAQGGYLVFHISPTRMDLFDESRGWGARETLEFE